MAKGEYRIKVPVGTYNIEISKKGSLTKEVFNVQVLAGKVTMQNIQLTSTLPTENIFGCIMPRMTDKELMPRISCLFGNEVETAQETPFQIECLWPRISCLNKAGML